MSNPISEAEASIRLQMASSDPDSFNFRIIKEWFLARRTIGIEGYGEQSLIEEIEKLKAKQK